MALSVKDFAAGTVEERISVVVAPEVVPQPTSTGKVVPVLLVIERDTLSSVELDTGVWIAQPVLVPDVVIAVRAAQKRTPPTEKYGELMSGLETPP